MRYLKSIKIIKFLINNFLALFYLPRLTFDKSLNKILYFASSEHRIPITQAHFLFSFLHSRIYQFSQMYLI